ncbi:hypothetical protein [Mycobacterium avium]|uniref:hypothetical protein n=2 Tax=Mycobacterium avium TaxID=1764 RepID=UPI001140E87F|nr:hypothetical protein [Mycobacterium avium]MCA4734123.1 hypothetical protein [Mycobacterium avium subsp. hominissuis]MCA4738549.1 hypothetical protein [Mycobacterium avium subsp. hominissuis]MCA4742956.1 hypothetical protein [Mycobacterium avium subsp. hominissuis]MCA4764195.1 hypothetical protein [Mycobacterium avium subsp. hominissuis]UBU99882.1 hypothetical protein H8Z48_19250 [Mycobacterium avium subsp. hominissuis]
MGRKSRHKLERRLGQVQPTRKEAERARLKAERRARHVPATVEAYEHIARYGPDRLAETLAGRHSMRIDNLDAVAQRSMDECLPHLLSVCEVDAAFIRRGRYLTQHATPHLSPWPTHLSWSLLSTVAALRLMLAGQTVSAAIVLRQHLGRWTRLLALADPVAWRRRESIESFIARAWTQRAMNTLGRYTNDVAAGDIFDDLDDHPPTTGVIGAAHEHVQSGDRLICPAGVYHALCMLIDGQQPDQRTQCDVVRNIDAEHSPTDAFSDALILCIIQMRLAAAAVCRASRDLDTAHSVDTESMLARPLAQDTSQSPLRLRESLVPRLTPTLVPLDGNEIASYTNIECLGTLFDTYHSVLSNQSPAVDYTPREFAELAFAAHRFSRFLVAEAAHAHDVEISHGRLKIHHYYDHMPVQILTAEFAALCALWNQSRPEIAAAATLISSTLLSGYWLWLEDDDRAMAILRCTLHQTARLRAWHTKPDAAQALQSIPQTTPRRWRNVAGWSQHRSLDLALFEFAHANRESRLDAAAILLNDDDHDPQHELSQRLARQTVLDKVTTLAATETIKVVATHQSAAIAKTMREALHQHGLDLRTTPTRQRPNKHAPARHTTSPRSPTHHQ